MAKTPAKGGRRPAPAKTARPAPKNSPATSAGARRGRFKAPAGADIPGLEPYDPRDPLSIPPALRVTAERRQELWDEWDRSKPPGWTPPGPSDFIKRPLETREDLERDPKFLAMLRREGGETTEERRARRLAEMKARFAHRENSRWDSRRARWVPMVGASANTGETAMETAKKTPAAKKPAAKKAAAKKPAAKKADGGRNMKLHASVIKIVSDKNPGREGSRRADVFNMLKNGMTVGDAIAAVNKSKHAADNYNPVGTLRWLEEQKAIKLEEPKATAA